MTAIVTAQFRHLAAEEFINDLVSYYTEDNNSYYLTIGRPSAWTDENSPDAPYDNTYSYRTDFWNRMLALKLLTSADVSRVAYRYTWVTGSTDFVEYDDRDIALSTSSYFTITENNNVYICLKKGAGASTISPDVTIGTTTTDPDPDVNTGGDGYLWKYLFTLDAAAATKFLTTAFIPVTTLSADPGGGASTALQNQWAVQSNATDGAIFNIKVTNGGSGYSTAPTVTITGDAAGSGCTATATVNGGVVTGITVNTIGSGYRHATISFSGGGGSGAAARAVIGPVGGFGADPVRDLGAHFVGINTALNYAEGGGDFPVNQDFRQIGIVRNPYNYGTTTVATASTLNANGELTVGTGYAFTADMIIEGTSSGAKAIVVTYSEDTNGYIRYVQTEETGFVPFTLADTVGESGNPGGEVGVSVLTNPEVQHNSGQVLFQENRTAINRAGDQIETIKLVLEF